MSALSYLILPWFVLSWQVGNWEHSAIIPTRKYGRRRRILDHKRQENSASRLYFIGIHHRKERENSGNWKESRYDLLDVKSEGKKSYPLYVTISKWSLHRVNRQSCLFTQKKEKKSEKALFLQAGSNQWSKEILRVSESFFILRTVALIAWSPHISLRLYQIYAQDKTWWDVEKFWYRNEDPAAIFCYTRLWRGSFVKPWSAVHSGIKHVNKLSNTRAGVKVIPVSWSTP